MSSTFKGRAGAEREEESTPLNVMTRSLSTQKQLHVEGWGGVESKASATLLAYHSVCRLQRLLIQGHSER